MNKYKFLLIGCVFVSLIGLFYFVNVPSTKVIASINEEKQNNDYLDKIVDHPRILITAKNRELLKSKAQNRLKNVYAFLLKKMAHWQTPRTLEDLRDYIYKYGYLYQMTGDKIWAEYVLKAMEQIPVSVEAYGRKNDSLAFAIEGLGIGLDWCYDVLKESGKIQETVNLINEYYPGNSQNLFGDVLGKNRLSDFHNYAAKIEYAMLVAGLATYGDNPKAASYLEEVRQIMETGVTRGEIHYNVLDSIRYVNGTCNWEGVTYGRHQLFYYIKYVESWRSATNGYIDLWKTDFNLLENAGYYIIYSLRPDKLFENIKDVNYRRLSYYDINNMSALQGIFHNQFFSTFVNENYKVSQSLDTEIWLGRYNSPLIFYLLWYDPDVPEADLAELPISKKFGDTIIMRTGFKPDDTFITFTSGIHWGHHSQLDHGSFTFYKYAPLAIDSGYYDKWWGEGNIHNWNYWKRSVAHNTILLHDPEWPELHYPQKLLLNNDGGQRMAFMTLSPPNSWSGATNKPFSIDDLNKRIDEFQMGTFTGYEESERHVYIKSDLTNAYNNKYAGTGNNPRKRSDKVVREFIFLLPNTLVIYDKVQLEYSVITPNWLLHTGDYYTKSGKPILNGTLNVIEGTEFAGIISSQDSDQITISQNDASLLIKSILPEKRTIKRIGGSGYEFWADGKNWPIGEKGIIKGRENENPGAWRIEITPQREKIEEKSLINLFLSAVPSPRSGNDEYVEFLNILSPFTNDTKVPLINRIVVNNKALIGVSIKTESDAYIVLINREDWDFSTAIKYRATDQSFTKHLLVGVPPDRYYEETVQQTENGSDITIKMLDTNDSELRSSSNGTLSFLTY